MARHRGTGWVIPSPPKPCPALAEYEARERVWAIGERNREAARLAELPPPLNFLDHIYKESK
jgi:hypothetical protein